MYSYCIFLLFQKHNYRMHTNTQMSSEALYAQQRQQQINDQQTLRQQQINEQHTLRQQQINDAAARRRHPSWASTGSGSSGSSSSGGRPSPTSMISYNDAASSPAGSSMSMDIVCRDRASPPSNISSFSQQLAQQQQSIHRRLDRSISEPVDRQSKTINSVNSGRYKTELCRPFEENGYCKYGDKCQFAHGGPELRNLARHPKYKTELCRTFHTIGFCPYGPRCHFIHNEDERRLSQITHMKQQQAQQVAIHQVVQHQQQPPISRQMSQPTPITQQQQQRRPHNFTLTLSASVRDSLGSTADSPSTSPNGSPPNMSPVSFASDDTVSLQSLGFTPSQLPISPPASAPADIAPTFTYPSSLIAELQRRMDPAVASLIAGLDAVRPSHTNTPVNSIYNSPPSPPDSVDGDLDPLANVTFDSPLDVSRSLRLPIFSQLAVGAQN